MNFRYQRSYTGPIQAVIFDWAGTTVDYGCIAPAMVFIEVFRREGVPITMEEARAPMGAHKRTHIQQISAMDTVRQRWIEQHGQAPDKPDVDRMYQAFIPLQLACLSQYSQLIPGTLEVVAACRQSGIKIGSTTGYDRDMLAVNVADAERQGYSPDANVCASDVPVGRPYPSMCMQAVIDLQIETVAACVKVDDTVPGIDEGLNAGMWTVGFAVSGNEMGLSRDEIKALTKSEFERKSSAAYRRLAQAGAHYVVDSIAKLLPCLDHIQARIRRGEKP